MRLGAGHDADTKLRLGVLPDIGGEVSDRRPASGLGAWSVSTMGYVSRADRSIASPGTSVGVASPPLSRRRSRSCPARLAADLDHAVTSRPARPRARRGGRRGRAWGRGRRRASWSATSTRSSTSAAVGGPAVEVGRGRSSIRSGCGSLWRSRRRDLDAGDVHLAVGGARATRLLRRSSSSRHARCRSGPVDDPPSISSTRSLGARMPASAMRCSRRRRTGGASPLWSLEGGLHRAVSSWPQDGEMRQGRRQVTAPSGRAFAPAAPA